MGRNIYWRNCKYCGAEIVWFKVNGNYIAVNRETITQEERRSLSMGATPEMIKFSPSYMKKHNETCPKAPKKQVDSNPYLFTRY